MNLQNRNRLIDIDNRLLYREWMNIKVLLYNTGNYIQYLVINHKENNLNDICVYIYTHI